jgi:glutamine---fructose-6-phosphate transaminase (isomerizing)
MCGIVGYIGKQNSVSFLVNGLKRLEYRGYDSAGIVVCQENRLFVQKSVGKIAVLEAKLVNSPMDGNCGIGHTRWATHGEPTENNAHPHLDGHGRLAIVHNGIIENYSSLRKELLTKGHTFKSETDSEILVHLFEEYMQNGTGIG